MEELKKNSKQDVFNAFCYYFEREIGKMGLYLFYNENDELLVYANSLFPGFGKSTDEDIILTKNPAIRHPQSRVRAVCYLNKSENEYQDFKILEGPLLQLFEELLNFIIRNTSTTAIFSKTDAQRKTNFQYPINAIREGLINAFAHRDYSSYSGGIKVEISPKQLSIWNSGSLPLGVSIKSLKNGQISILRNPDIANYLHFQGYMEMLGRGSVLIQDECKKANLPSPEWKADSLGVTLTFFATSHSTEITNTELLTLYNAELKTTSKLNDVMTALTIQDMSQSEIAFALKLNSVSGALKRAIDILENKFKFIEKVVPQKTRSKMQKYHLTSLGANFWHLYKK
jgi:ATP-dependent DNA helicase RecG